MYKLVPFIFFPTIYNIIMIKQKFYYLHHNYSAIYWGYTTLHSKLQRPQTAVAMRRRGHRSTEQPNIWLTGKDPSFKTRPLPTLRDNVSFSCCTVKKRFMPYFSDGKCQNLKHSFFLTLNRKKFSFLCINCIELKLKTKAYFLKWCINAKPNAGQVYCLGNQIVLLQWQYCIIKNLNQ